MNMWRFSRLIGLIAFVLLASAWLVGRGIFYSSCGHPALVTQRTEAAQPVPDGLHQIIAGPENVIGMRSIGRKKCAAINKVAQVGILLAVLGKPRVQIGIASGF